MRSRQSELAEARELITELANYLGKVSISCGHCIGHPSVRSHSPDCVQQGVMLKKSRQFLASENDTSSADTATQ